MSFFERKKGNCHAKSLTVSDLGLDNTNAGYGGSSSALRCIPALTGTQKTEYLIPVAVDDAIKVAPVPVKPIPDAGLYAALFSDEDLEKLEDKIRTRTTTIHR